MVTPYQGMTEAMSVHLAWNKCKGKSYVESETAWTRMIRLVKVFK